MGSALLSGDNGVRVSVHHPKMKQNPRVLVILYYVLLSVRWLPLGNDAIIDKDVTLYGFRIYIGDTLHLIANYDDY